MLPTPPPSLDTQPLPRAGPQMCPSAEAEARAPPAPRLLALPKGPSDRRSPCPAEAPGGPNIEPFGRCSLRAQRG